MYGVTFSRSTTTMGALLLGCALVLGCSGKNKLSDKVSGSGAASGVSDKLKDVFRVRLTLASRSGAKSAQSPQASAAHGVFAFPQGAPAGEAFNDAEVCPAEDDYACHDLSSHDLQLTVDGGEIKYKDGASDGTWHPWAAGKCNCLETDSTTKIRLIQPTDKHYNVCTCHTDDAVTSDDYNCDADEKPWSGDSKALDTLGSITEMHRIQFHVCAKDCTKDCIDPIVVVDPTSRN